VFPDVADNAFLVPEESLVFSISVSKAALDCNENWRPARVGEFACDSTISPSRLTPPVLPDKTLAVESWLKA
jgi:hypothetical protein